MLGNRQKATHPPEISLDFVGVCKSGCFLHIVGKHIQFNIMRKENEHLFARTTLAGKCHSHPGGASMALSLSTCCITFFEKVQQINSTWATQMRQASCIVFRSAFETQQKATRPPQISLNFRDVRKSIYLHAVNKHKRICINQLSKRTYANADNPTRKTKFVTNLHKTIGTQTRIFLATLC